MQGSKSSENCKQTADFLPTFKKLSKKIYLPIQTSIQEPNLQNRNRKIPGCSDENSCSSALGTTFDHISGTPDNTEQAATNQQFPK